MLKATLVKQLLRLNLQNVNILSYYCLCSCSHASYYVSRCNLYFCLTCRHIQYMVNVLKKTATQTEIYTSVWFIYIKYINAYNHAMLDILNRPPDVIVKAWTHTHTPWGNIYRLYTTTVWGKLSEWYKMNIWSKRCSGEWKLSQIWFALKPHGAPPLTTANSENNTTTVTFHCLCLWSSNSQWEEPGGYEFDQYGKVK